VIEFFRRLFGSGTTWKESAAPLNHRILLVIGRRQRGGASGLRASRTVGRRGARCVASIYEVGDGDTEEVPSTTSVDELAHQARERLGPEASSELFEFISDTVVQDLEKPGGDTLARSLHVLRERLRRRLPRLEAGGDEPCHFDSITMVDEHSVWVHGWCSGGDEVLAHIEVISPEGHSAGNLAGAYRFRRPDVEEALGTKGIPEVSSHGFSKYLQMSKPSRLGIGWLAELRGPSGSGVAWPLADAGDPVVATELIMREVNWPRPNLEELRIGHAYPALQRNLTHLRQMIRVTDAVQHGQAPTDPDVSIVVPLYERIDLVEHQIAQFWPDPDFETAELIYVLDDPKLAHRLQQITGELHALYGLPFVVLTLSRNAGYAAANNVAAEHARGRLLLLLNSDVIPTEPGWLGRMRRFFDATPQIGALGPKLLFEDDSIQHAGMFFERDPITNWWHNLHFYKGYDRALPAANVSRPVPAVTGACMMTERAMYQKLGGLSEDYIRGGYEDSDLCLRLREEGRENWYLADVELYHLEAQSFPIPLRNTNSYNSWLQNHLWDDQIEQVMREQAEMAELHELPVG
jgi:GT2 family glycosyltransferase